MTLDSQTAIVSFALYPEPTPCDLLVSFENGIHLVQPFSSVSSKQPSRPNNDVLNYRLSIPERISGSEQNVTQARVRKDEQRYQIPAQVFHLGHLLCLFWPVLGCLPNCVNREV